MKAGRELDAKIDKLAYETKPYKEFVAKAWYLKEGGDALIHILHKGKMVREFLFPAYKIWNIGAHLQDIAESEINNDDRGYQIAAFTGL